MLAQESCCTRSRVGGRSCQRKRVQVRFSAAVLAFVVVAHQFRQKSASISEATSRRRFQCFCCASRACCPNWEHACVSFMFFFCAKVTVVHLMSCERCFVSSASSSRVKTLRAAVMEARELLRSILGMSRFAPNPKAVDILRQEGSSRRMRQLCANVKGLRKVGQHKIDHVPT